MGGSIDVLLADGSFIKTAVEGSNGEMEMVGPDVVIGGGVGIGMRPDDSALQEKMKTALEAVKKDGTLDALIKQYFNAGPYYSGS